MKTLEKYWFENKNVFVSRYSHNNLIFSFGLHKKEKRGISIHSSIKMKINNEYLLICDLHTFNVLDANIDDFTTSLTNNCYIGFFDRNENFCQNHFSEALKRFFIDVNQIAMVGL